MHNPIATRNLKRMNGNANIKTAALSPVLLSNLFIEEPGKTKVIDLMNIAEKKTLTQLRSGERIDLVIKRMKIFVYDSHKQFVGMLPDDLSRRMIKFMEAGNIYEACIKNMDSNKVTIFIREIKRATRLKNQPTFLSSIPLDKSRLGIKPLAEQDHQSLRDGEEEDL